MPTGSASGGGRLWNACSAHNLSTTTPWTPRCKPKGAVCGPLSRRFLPSSAHSSEQLILIARAGSVEANPVVSVPAGVPSRFFGSLAGGVGCTTAGGANGASREAARVSAMPTIEIAPNSTVQVRSVSRSVKPARRLTTQKPLSWPATCACRERVGESCQASRETGPSGALATGSENLCRLTECYFGRPDPQAIGRQIAFGRGLRPPGLPHPATRIRRPAKPGSPPLALLPIESRSRPPTIAEPSVTPERAESPGCTR